MIAPIILAGGAVILAKTLEDHSEFTSRAKPFREMIAAAALRYDVNPHILAAIAWQETRFNPSATGTAGEIGMFQFLPIAFKDIIDNGNYKEASSVRELYDPRKGAFAAASLIALNTRRAGSVWKAVRAYNVGIGASNDVTKGATYLANVVKHALIDQLSQQFSKAVA